MEWLVAGLVIFVVFGYGVVVGRYRTPPFGLLSWLNGNLPKSIRPYYLVGDWSSDIKVDSEVLSQLDHRTDFEVHMIGKKEKHSGNCVCIIIDDKTIVMDTGKQRAARSIIDYLTECGVEKIDLLIISHYHGDHVGGIEDFKKEFEIGNVSLPEFTKKDAREEDIKDLFDGYDTVTSNDKKEIDDITISFYGPEKEFQRDNNNSIVCKIEANGIGLLLTGDAEKEAEEYIVNSSADLDADILQVGHHGRNTSSTPEFLSAIDPKYAIIFSDGCLPNSHPDVISRLVNISESSVYDTSAHGSIVVQVSDGDIECYSSVA